jgi:ADP-ribose pyrophosphatase
MQSIYKILKSEVVYKGRLTTVRYQLEDENGRQFINETIEHPGAVVVLPITDQGEIVCVSQYRHAVRSTILELPAGTLEQDEDPLDCARREIAEEIGMGARQIVSLGELLPCPGFCSEVQHLYVARDLYPEVATPDEDERIAVVKMSLPEFEAAILNGDVRDGKSLALFARARLAGEI